MDVEPFSRSTANTAQQLPNKDNPKNLKDLLMMKKDLSIIKEGPLEMSPVEESCDYTRATLPRNAVNPEKMEDEDFPAPQAPFPSPDKPMKESVSSSSFGLQTSALKCQDYGFQTSVHKYQQTPTVLLPIEPQKQFCDYGQQMTPQKPSYQPPSAFVWQYENDPHRERMHEFARQQTQFLMRCNRSNSQSRR